MRSTISIPDGLAYGGNEPLPATDDEQALLQAIANTVHRFPGGVEALAKRMGMSANTLQHKVNLNNTTHHLTAVELARLQRATGDYSASARLVAPGGYACVLVNPTTPANVMDGVARMTNAMAELINAVHDATESGLPVTRQQNRRSEFHLAELIGAANALVALQRARTASHGGPDQ